MRVKMPLRMGFAIGRTLVKSHRVGKRSLEEVVVARGEPFEDVAGRVAFFPVQFVHRSDVAARKDHSLEGPYGPEGNEGQEMVVLGHGSNP